MRSGIDYALARRAVLSDLERGTRARHDVCDAHPELLRAGRYVGSPAGACPVCEAGSLRMVSYVYGDKLKAANGRCVASADELARLGRTHDEFCCYDVEVCVDCGWNHLRRASWHGRKHAS